VWKLYLTSKATFSRPSHVAHVRGGPWVRLMFDNAVTLVGTVLENASQERVQVGDDTHSQWLPKYTMRQLLDPDFRLPIDKEEEPLPIETLQVVHGIVYDEVA
jgi:hypothetical protein